MDKDDNILVYDGDTTNAVGHFRRYLIPLLKRFYNYSRIERFYNIEKQEEYYKKYLRNDNEK